MILRNPYFEGTVRLLDKQQAAADGSGRFTDELVSRTGILDVVEELAYASMNVIQGAQRVRNRNNGPLYPEVAPPHPRDRRPRKGGP
jgi:hypothetical protein